LFNNTLSKVLNIICLVVVALCLLLSGCTAAFPTATGSSTQNAAITSTPEIKFVDGVPMVPSICPIIILSGSDYDMGYQYAQQVIQIFGPWIFKDYAGRKFSDTELAEIKKWEEPIKGYAPEILEMCRGWADGATQAGVPMSYYDVVELWTGHSPPAKELTLFDYNCSGVAAWGEATKDHKLVCGSSTDHNCAFQATIIAFPQTGNNYVYTPFSVNGSMADPPFHNCFSGHPGMNSAGLAYVHHGFGLTLEPQSDWGYGIRRGTSTFHNLRFCNNVEDVIKSDTSIPIGDSGRILGSAGGFWADVSGNACSIESKKDPVVIRRPGENMETDFMYANNNVLSAQWTGNEYVTKGLTFKPILGWHTMVPNLSQPTPFVVRDVLSKDSAARNLHFYNMLSHYLGQIDLSFMQVVYRQVEDIPYTSLQTAADKFRFTDEFWAWNTGRGRQAFVATMKPDKRGFGLYLGGIGQLSRKAMTAEQFNLYPDQTFTQWQITLAKSPSTVVANAKDTAWWDVTYANQQFAKLSRADAVYSELSRLLNESAIEMQKGNYYLGLVAKSQGNEVIYNQSKALRSFTRAQVRAKQVLEALVPPPETPADLGLKPYGYWEKTAE